MKQSLMGYIPTFSFDFPLNENYTPKIIDTGLIKEARKMVKKKKEKEKMEKVKRIVEEKDEFEEFKDIDFDDLVIDGSSGNAENDERMQRLKKKINQTMIDEDFLAAETYNTHMGRLGSVIRNIEARERKVKRALLQKKEKDFYDADDLPNKRKRRGPKRKKKKKKSRKRRSGVDLDEYDFEDDFLDDGEYNDFVPKMDERGLGGDDNSRSMHAWIEDNSNSQPPSFEPENTGFEFEEPNTFMGREFDPSMVDALKKLDAKLKKIPSKRFEWIDINQEFTVVSQLRRKFYKHGVPAALANALKELPHISSFSKATIKSRMKYLLNLMDIRDMGRRVEEIFERLKYQIRNDLIKMIIKVNPNLTIPEITSRLMQTCKELNIQYTNWSKEADNYFFEMMQIMRETVSLHNSTRKKMGRDKTETRNVEDEEQEKFTELMQILPNKVNFTEKFRMMKKNKPVKKYPTRKNTKKKKKKGKSTAGDTSKKRKTTDSKKTDVDGDVVMSETKKTSKPLEQIVIIQEKPDVIMKDKIIPIINPTNAVTPPMSGNVMMNPGNIHLNMNLPMKLNIPGVVPVGGGLILNRPLPNPADELNRQVNPAQQLALGGGGMMFPIGNLNVRKQASTVIPSGRNNLLDIARKLSNERGNSSSIGSLILDDKEDTPMTPPKNVRIQRTKFKQIDLEDLEDEDNNENNSKKKEEIVIVDSSDEEKKPKKKKKKKKKAKKSKKKKRSTKKRKRKGADEDEKSKKDTGEPNKKRRKVANRTDSKGPSITSYFAKKTPDKKS